MSKIVSLSCVLFLMLTMSAIAFGQSTVSGAIGGVVTNPNKEVVPGASITVLNTETNKEDTGNADDQGSFRIGNLQPGNYSVTINGSGFSPFTQSNVIVEVGRVTELNAALSIGPVSGTVEVTSEAPVINTSQQDFSTNINQTSISELPTNGRRWSNFALLTPGAVPDGVFGLVSFRGISGLLNNSTIDGGDNNQAFFSEERGRTRVQYSISQDAVREFQINTSNYSAEYGRAAGGVVNAVTKSGTNEFHGGAFLFVRDDRFNTRQPQTFLTLADGSVVGFKPEDNRKQFGGTIGGPIVKDKLFFFFSYDQQRRNFPGVAINNNLDFLTNINTSTLLARGVTQPQITSTVEFLRSLTGEVARRGDQLLFLPKIDWRITDNNTLTVTYNRLRWDAPNGIQTSSTVTRGRGSFGDDAVDLDWVTFRLSSTISPTIINEARFQWSREFARQNYGAPIPGEPTTAPGGAVPSIAITGGLTFGKPNFLDRRAFPLEKRQQYADIVTANRGNHTFKFGFDISHVTDVNDNLFTEAGSYLYTNINDFIMDYVNFQNGGALRTANRACPVTSGRIAGQCYSGTFLQGLGVPKFVFSTNDYNFFVQDDWRITSRLNLNLGVRYEYQKLPEPQVPNAAFDADPRFAGKTSIFPADKNNWGPRIGFAYDILGNGKFSVRGGYGIYFGRIQNSVISNAITNTGVANSQIQVSTSSIIFPNTLATGAGNVPNVVVFSPHMANPEIHQGDLVLERLIGRNTMVSASYLFSLGRKLPTFVDVNLNAPTASTTFTFQGGPLAGQTMIVPRFTNPRPNTTVNVVTENRSTIKSEYNALVLQLNRRLTNGIQFQSSYTWSQARDNGQARGTFTENNVPTNPFDYSQEQGVSDLDLRHRFVTSAVLNPGTIFGVGDSSVSKALFDDWSLAPVFVWQSGFPYDMGITGSAGGNPTIVSGGNNISGSRGRNRVLLFPRNAFRFPSFWNFDMRLSRRIKFSESTNIEFLAEGFNLFNRTHILGNLDTTAYQVSGNNLVFRPAFLTTTPPPGETLYKNRQFQFAVRFQF